MGKELYQVQGVDRLKLWLEMTHLQDADPERQVNQREPLSRVRAIHANPWLHQDWMTSCVPFLKLHSWSVDDPKHPKVVFNVRNKPAPFRDAAVPPVASMLFPAWSCTERASASAHSTHHDRLIRCDAVYYPAQ